MVIYDATVAPDHQVNHGPGDLTPRSHAFSDGAYISLCGQARLDGVEHQGYSPKCPQCRALLRQGAWTGR